MAQKDKEVKEDKMIQVRAKAIHEDGRMAGYYGHKRIREGELFLVKESEFSGRWMEAVKVNEMGIVLVDAAENARLLEEYGANVVKRQKQSIREAIAARA